MHDNVTSVFSVPVKLKDEIYFHGLQREIVFGVITGN